MNAAGLALLKEFEGWRAKAYPDPATGGAPWTIGYGFTRDVHPGDVMTPAEGDARLQYEVAHFEQAVYALTKHATENQLAAMTCLAYNIGLGNFKASTVLRKHNEGAHFEAANAFLLWNKAANRVMPGLTRRREAERALYVS